MTRAGLLPCSLRKEFRALAVPWLACLATLLAAAALGRGSFLGLAVPAYFVGAVALGALSVGHEYSHRTMGLLLSLPVRRERLFLEKMGVLAVQLLTLSAAAALMMADTPALRDAGTRSHERTAALVLPVLCGFFVAPSLTLLCRNAVAGTVFSIALPGLLLVTGEMAGVLLYGSRAAASDFRLLVVTVGMLAAGAIGSVSGWRLFRRLEAIEGRGQDVRLPRWGRRRSAAAVTARGKRHPVWRLVAKELRIQQMPLALGALYLLVWVAIASITPRFPLVMDSFEALTIFYCLLIALLIGCLAFADERQNGTLASQLLLPMPAWRPWAVKVGVALGLALVLGIGLPALVVGGTQLLPDGPRHEIGRWMLAYPAITLTVGGLYVSSLSRSGLGALLMSIPAVVGTAVFVGILQRPLRKAAFTLVSSLPASMIPARDIDLLQFIPQLSLVLVGGLLGLLLRFGYVNYRSTDRVRSRTTKQVTGLAAAVALTMIVVSAVEALGFASYDRLPRRSRPPVRQMSEAPAVVSGGSAPASHAGRAGLPRGTPSWVNSP